MPPKRANLVLTTDIPNVEFYVLDRDSFDVETDSGNGGKILVVDLELVEDGRLSGSVETQHQNAHFAGTEELAQDGRERKGVAHLWY